MKIDVEEIYRAIQRLRYQSGDDVTFTCHPEYWYNLRQEKHPLYPGQYIVCPYHFYNIHDGSTIPSELMYSIIGIPVQFVANERCKNPFFQVKDGPVSFVEGIHDEPADTDKERSQFVIRKGIYEHFKGVNYEVIGGAILTGTGDIFVVYHPLGFPTQLFVRPIDEFTENVSMRGIEIPRFKFKREST